MTNQRTTRQGRLSIACAIAAAFAAASLGCSQQPHAVAPAINDKVYTVTPASVVAKAGIVTGEITEMKVTERVEEGSGRVATPAKLTGKLALKNMSADQSVRLIGAKLLYIDSQGKPIQLEENRSEPMIKVGSSSYGSSDRLDPGQNSSQSVDAEFPVAALKAKMLKEIRLELSYIPTAYKEEKLNFAVSIGGQ